MRKIIRRFVSGLRLRLLLLVLLACAPLVGLMLHTTWQERRRQVKDWHQRSQEMVELATQEEDQVIEQTRQLLLAVAESSQVRSGNRRDCEKLLAALFASHSRYANLGVIKTNGDFLASVRAPAGPANQTDLQFLDRMLETRAFAIGNFPVGPTNGKATINFGYPVFDPSGQIVQAVAFAALDSDWFDRSGSKLLAHLPKGATWTEMDRTGRILIRYPAPEKWIGRPFPEKSLLETVLSQKQGVVETVSPAGLPDYYAFAAMRSRLVPGNVVTLLGIPKQVLFAEADSRLTEYLTWLGIAACFAFMLGWIGSYLVLRPVRTLVKSSARLATGEFSTRTGLARRGDEMGQLTRAFDHMAQALEQREMKRQSAENAMKASEMRYRRLFETAQAGILILNADTGQIDDVNPSLTDMLGYSREQLLGNKLWEIGPFKGTQASKAEFLELQRETYVRYDDLPLETRTGKSINVEFVSNVYQVNGGKVIQCNIRDITKRKQAETASIRLAAIVESSSDSILSQDPDSIVTSWNKGSEMLFGYTAGEMVGTSFMRLIPADRQDEENQILAKIKGGESVQHFETLRQTKDGRLINVSVTASPIKEASGKVIGVSKVASDISERKRAEAALRESEERMRLATEATAVGIWEWNVITNRIRWDAQMFQLYGIAPTKDGFVEYSDWSGSVLPEELRQQEELLQDTVRRRGRSFREFRIRRRYDGECRHIQAVETVRMNAKGQAEWVVGTNLDITERKRAEEELRGNEVRLRSVVESTADGLLVVDQNGRVIIQNGRFGEMWRIPSELLASGDDNALQAHVVGQLFDPEAFLAKVSALYGTDAEDMDELRFKDGRVFERFSRPLVLREGVMGRVWSFRDVTERNQAEAKRKAYSRKLQVLSRRLVEAQETERRNIARELHDEIGQALTVMQLNLQAMLQSPGTGDQPRLNESLKVVERVLEQVQDISLNLRPSILDDLGLEPALRWYTDRQAALLELKVEFHADRLEQRLDPVIETECFRVAQEALTNVVRHAQAKAVSVELRKEDGQLTLRVRDDGIGFDVAAMREKAVRGTSLGLLSMEERAALAGGGLEFTSIPGQGTEVHAWFPLKWQTPPSGSETS